MKDKEPKCLQGLIYFSPKWPKWQGTVHTTLRAHNSQITIQFTDSHLNFPISQQTHTLPSLPRARPSPWLTSSLSQHHQDPPSSSRRDPHRDPHLTAARPHLTASRPSPFLLVRFRTLTLPSLSISISTRQALTSSITPPDPPHLLCSLCVSAVSESWPCPFHVFVFFSWKESSFGKMSVLCDLGIAPFLWIFGDREDCVFLLCS